MKNFFKILTHLFPWNATPHKNFDLVCVSEKFLNAFTSADNTNDKIKVIKNTTSSLSLSEFMQVWNILPHDIQDSLRLYFNEIRSDSTSAVLKQPYLVTTIPFEEQKKWILHSHYLYVYPIGKDNIIFDMMQYAPTEHKEALLTHFLNCNKTFTTVTFEPLDVLNISTFKAIPNIQPRILSETEAEVFTRDIIDAIIILSDPRKLDDNKKESIKSHINHFIQWYDVQPQKVKEHIHDQLLLAMAAYVNQEKKKKENPDGPLQKSIQYRYNTSCIEPLLKHLVADMTWKNVDMVSCYYDIKNVFSLEELSAKRINNYVRNKSTSEIHFNI